MPISDGRITSRQLCVGAITERTIADGAVSGGKIADGAIDGLDVFGSGLRPVQYVSSLPVSPTPSDGDLAFLSTNGKLYRYTGSAWTVAVDGTDIVDGTIVASDKIQANSITAAEIAANTITAGQIAAATITASQIAAGTITATELNVTSLDAITATMGSLTGGTITAADMYSSNWVSGGGTVPLSLPDSGATTGWALDGSTGVIQVYDLQIMSSDTKPVTFRNATAGAAYLAIDPLDQNVFRLRMGGDPTAVDTFRIATAGEVVQAEISDGGVAIRSGSAGAPGLTFLTDPDTGMYNSGGDALAFSTAGVQRFLIGSSYLTGNGDAGSAYVRSAAGAVGTPTYTFDADPDTGMYRISGDTVGFAAGGARRFAYDSNIVVAGAGVTGNPQLKADAAGSAASPTYTFYGDNDSGFYRSGSDQIAVSLGGAYKFVFDTTGLAGGLTTGGPWVLSAAGSATTPTYAFYGDENTGMYRSTTDQLSFAAGGSQRVIIGTSGYLNYGIRDNTSGSLSDLVRIDSTTGQMYRVTATPAASSHSHSYCTGYAGTSGSAANLIHASNTSRYLFSSSVNIKTDISPLLDTDLPTFVPSGKKKRHKPGTGVLQLTPIRFRSLADKERSENDKRLRIGLLAEQAQQVFPEAYVPVPPDLPDGHPSVDYNAVTAALLAEVIALTERVSQLEMA